MTLYMKGKDGKFVELTEWGKDFRFGYYLSKRIPYGTMKKVDDSELSEIARSIDADVQRLTLEQEKYRSRAKLISEMTATSIEQKLEAIDKLEELIDDIKADKEEAYAAAAEARLILRMSVNIPLYIGYEVDIESYHDEDDDDDSDMMGMSD